MIKNGVFTRAGYREEYTNINGSTYFFRQWIGAIVIAFGTRFDDTERDDRALTRPCLTRRYSLPE